MATETANGYYRYSEIICGKELRDLVQAAHKYNSAANGWRIITLKEGCFGFDNLAVCIGHANEVTCGNFKSLTVEQLAEVVHDAWIFNYTYWRDNAPHTRPGYTAPSKKLGDAQRNKSAEQSYAELPEEEKEKDRVIARYLHTI